MRTSHHRKTNKVLLSILLSVLVLTLASCKNMGSINSNGSTPDQPNNGRTSNYSPSMPIKVRFNDYGDVMSYDHASVIEKQIQVLSSRDCIREIYIDCPDGVELLSEKKVSLSDNGIITIAFRLSDEFFNGEITINAFCYKEGKREFGGGENIFLLHEGDKDYTNYISNEWFEPYSERIKEYYDHLRNKGTEVHYNYHDDTSERGPVNYFHVYGYIYWEDEIGIAHPARNVTVGIYNSDSGTIPMATVLTNDSGYYDYEWNSFYL